MPGGVSMITRSTSFSAERARVRSVSASATFTFSTQWESIPWPWEAQAARLCWGSASSTMTLRPMAANSAARLPAMVDLPTPPFRPATAMIAIEVGITIIAYSGAGEAGGMQERIYEAEAVYPSPAQWREAAAASFCWAFFCLRGKRDLPLLASLGILIFLGGVAGLATPTAAGAET